MKQILLLVLFIAVANCKSIENKITGKKKFLII